MNRNALRRTLPLTKTSSAAGNNAMQALEQADELNKCLRQVQRVDDATKKMLKDAKRGTECLHEMTRSEQKLAQELSSSQLCHHDERLRLLVEEFYSVAKQMDEATNEWILITQKAAVDPLKKFMTVFQHAGGLLKKREQQQQECQKWKIRVERWQEKEKTGQNLARLVQLKKDWAQAQEELAKHDACLSRELPLLLNARIPFFQPSFQALIRGQMEYFGANMKLYTDLAQNVPSAPALKDEEFQQQFHSRLQEIKSLSIVGDV